MKEYDAFKHFVEEKTYRSFTLLKFVKELKTYLNKNIKQLVVKKKPKDKKQEAFFMKNGKKFT